MSARPAKPACFKAYDIRGKVPSELDADLAYRIGLSTARYLKARHGGRRPRLPAQQRPLATALTRGLTDAGADVLDIGLCGTEMVYHATFARGLDGGIMVTASHNPMDHNGMKLVRERRPAHQRRQRAGRHRRRGHRLRPDPRAQARHGHARRHAARVHRLPGRADRPGAAEAPAHRGQRRQRLRRPGGGGAGPAPAGRDHPGLRRAGRQLPQRHPQPAAAGEPQRHRRGRADSTAPTWAWPGTATSTAASSSTRRGAFIEGYYLVGLLAHGRAARRTRAGASSTTRG